MESESNTNTKNLISSSVNIAYFALAFFQTIAELFDFINAALTLRIIIPLLLTALYYIHSVKQNALFYIAMVLLLISNVFFFRDHAALFFYGIVAFILLRIVTLVHILKLSEHKNYLHIIVASFPFLVIFFYLISATNEISEYEFNLLIVQSILIAMLGGISVVNYLKDDNRQNSWLLISTLLFVGLRFIIYIERYFISNLSLTIYIPIEIVLNVFAFYTYYKYVTAAESNERKNFTTNHDKA